MKNIKTLVTAKRFTKNTARKIAAIILLTPNTFSIVTDFPFEKHSERYAMIASELEKTRGVLSVVEKTTNEGLKIAAYTENI